MHRPGADADAPLATAHECEHDVDDRRGVVHHPLHLVTRRPLEGAQHAWLAGQPAEQVIDLVAATPAVSLVDRQHEHAATLREGTVKAQSFIRPS